MKKLLLGSVLALSSVFTVTACTSVNATTDTTPSTTKMQKQHKAGMKKGDMKKGGMRGPLSQLDLTEAQQTQIKAIMQKQHGDNKADRTENKAERAQMHQQIQALTNARTLNNAAVSRLADQQAAKEKQRFIERVQTQHAIAQVLTAEQRAELAQMKEERKNDRKGDREPRGERPQPGM
ncbi:Spy/CpxP family protein refolding chaperone [Psychrobacter sp. SCQQ22]|uniref:Spy/CpxP family protein refolding chaperone n=1 Tax=Psychrobacter sp. SCQQ22 TaxID=2792059 RepID=UPI0018CD3784|nr:Spy/CpxP family protein refolding chaperone [Psychrobacter sp. SCQQ22]MBH0085158.1 Spy/CpxP family protein refolding chaperone [Psychrobacter sp. SCQQ22]